MKPATQSIFLRRATIDAMNRLRCVKCQTTFWPNGEPNSICAACSVNHDNLVARQFVEKALREELSKVKKDLQKVKAELQRVQSNFTFLQAWGDDMFSASVADVWLRTTDQTCVTLGAHRCVLASKSPVFKAMFFNGMREKETGLVEIADISSDVLQALIMFIYKANVKEDFLAVQVQPLLEAAIKYDIEGLQHFCIKYILENCIPSAPYKDGEVDHVTCLLQLALKHNLTEVKGAVVNKLARSGPAEHNRELQMLLVCDRFRSVKEMDPLQALEICECMIGDARAQKQSP